MDNIYSKCQEQEAREQIMGKAALYASLPFTVLVTVAVGYYGGQWIDQQYGTKYANVIGIVFGLALGLFEVIRQLKRLEKTNL